MADEENLAKFAAMGLEAWGRWRCEWDGGELQDALEKCGLLESGIYDPAKHGEIEDVEPGDPCMLYTPLAKQLFKRFPEP